MKIEQAVKDFKPVTITLETFEELVVFAVSIGNISAHDISSHAKRDYGVELDAKATTYTSDTAYLALDKAVRA